MALDDIENPRSILLAIGEFRTLGRDQFLKKYGFGRAKEYYLVIDGNYFDSKAIVGVAHQYEFPDSDPLKYNEFGPAAVRQKLEELGFEVLKLNKSQVLELNGPESLAFIASEQATRDNAFDPSDDNDARIKILSGIVRRQGQPAFRQELLEAYGGCCAVTGTAIPEILEAAHIVPYKGPHTNHVSNGLLLRADLHTLFDMRLIAFDDQFNIIVSGRLFDTEYNYWGGRALRLPDEEGKRPNLDALRAHRRACQL